jgi:hypothetical protein
MFSLDVSRQRILTMEILQLPWSRRYCPVNIPKLNCQGLLFTIAAGPRQRSHFQVRVPRDSWSYFTVSDPRLPQPGGPGPRMYITHEQDGPVIPPGTGFPFRRLLQLARLLWRYSPFTFVFKITPRHGPCRKHSPSIVLEACLPRRSIQWSRHGPHINYSSSIVAGIT